ncbi:MAG: hypothetical protein ACRDH2_01290 [Anaerolineales bacterium]
MKLSRRFLYPFAGWVAGAIVTVGLGFLWPSIFPAIVRIEHYYGAGPGLPVILLIVLILVSPAALVGGLIGSRIPKEGGRGEQLLVAAILGAIMALPFGCWGWWFFTGW